MPIDYDTLMNWHFDDLSQSYTTRDAMLYALSVGLGQPADDIRQLPFVYEKDLVVLPTMVGILGTRAMWLDHPGTGVDWRKSVGGGIGIRLFKPLPPAATIVSTQRVTGIVDRGVGKGAILFNERDIRDAATNDVLAVVEWTNILRGDGGFGGPSGPRPVAHPIPERQPDTAVDMRISEQAGLLYRLFGDRHPIHIDPASAVAAGFARPTLQGHCTLGHVGHALLKACAAYRPERLRSLSGRLSAPVYPGETLRTEIWVDQELVTFRALAMERNVVVVNNGHAEIAAG
jgi:acyl dehydratase